nr:methyltransferase [Fulvivirga sp. M361]
MRDKQKIFHFKKFDVNHTESAMKVGTDGVLLGSWAESENVNHILDIGTGCGLIALMLAQRFSKAKITAIDIDKASAGEAKRNFSNSPWKDRLNSIVTSLQQFNGGPEKFDLIVSNPPYFNHGTSSPNTARHYARHIKSLSHPELLGASSRLLSSEGKLCVIIPAYNQDIFMRTIPQKDLYVHKRLHFYSRADKPCERVLLQISKKKASIIKEEALTHYTTDGSWSNAYKRLTQAFHPML